LAHAAKSSRKRPTRRDTKSLDTAPLATAGERSAQPARVSAAQVHSQDRFVDALGAALIARNDPAAPLATPAIFGVDPRPRHCDGGRAEARAQGSPALAVSIPNSNRADSL
jgi:hypothetical protein